MRKGIQVKHLTDGLVVLAVGEAWDRGLGEVTGQDLLMKWSGACGKVALLAMDRADRRGLLEYGVSLRCAWLTSQGEAMAEELINRQKVTGDE